MAALAAMAEAMEDVTDLTADVVEAKVQKKISLIILSICIGVFALTFLKRFSGRFSIMSSDRTQCTTAKRDRQPFWEPCGFFKSTKESHSFYLFKNISQGTFSYTYLNDVSSRNMKALGLTATDSIFTHVKFVSGDFSNAEFRGNRISLSDFSSSTFAESRFVGNIVEYSNLLDANFKNVLLHGTRFISCNLQGADFRGADLHDTVFILSSLKGAVFDAKTRLPFPSETAQGYGMTYVE
jgi:uncharacterized protein YjbI with pentapeptide repeats